MQLEPALILQIEQAAEKGPDARRRPTAAREAYSMYVERAAEGADEADGRPSQPPASWRICRGTVSRSPRQEGPRSSACGPPPGAARCTRGPDPSTPARR